MLVTQVTASSEAKVKIKTKASLHAAPGPALHNNTSPSGKLLNYDIMLSREKSHCLFNQLSSPVLGEIRPLQEMRPCQ